MNEIRAQYCLFFIKWTVLRTEKTYLQKINVQKYIPKVKKRCYNMYTE